MLFKCRPLNITYKLTHYFCLSAYYCYLRFLKLIVHNYPLFMFKMQNSVVSRTNLFCIIMQSTTAIRYLENRKKQQKLLIVACFIYRTRFVLKIKTYFFILINFDYLAIDSSNKRITQQVMIMKMFSFKLY